MKKSLIVSFLILVWSVPVSAAIDRDVESLRKTSSAFASVGQEVSPSVVFIQVESKIAASNTAHQPYGNGSPYGDDFLRRFFGDQLPVALTAPTHLRIINLQLARVLALSFQQRIVFHPAKHIFSLTIT